MTFVSPTLYLERGADVNAKRRDHWTPLHLASYWCGKPDIVRVLLDHGAKVNGVDNLLRTPLHLVAVGPYESKEDGVSVARLLLERGADASALDLNSETPLHLASSLVGRLEIAQLLLEHATVKNDLGQNPPGLQGEYFISPKIIFALLILFPRARRRCKRTTEGLLDSVASCLSIWEGRDCAGASRPWCKPKRG